MFPMRSAATGANDAAIGKKTPLCLVPNINYLFLKYGLLFSFYAAKTILFGLFTPYSL